MSVLNKLKAIIWPVVYIILIATVCVNVALIFHSYYYTPIYISGQSMEPTLDGFGEMVDYGIIDDHPYAIDNVTKRKNRFKIITTYYPFANGSSSDYKGGYVHGGENVLDENASYKIKRIYAFPGECFKFETDGSTVNFYVKDGTSPLTWEGVKPCQITFDRKIDLTNTSRNYNYVHDEPLGEDEYWVMGDNYDQSFDCFSTKKPIYRDNIVGVLIAIEGQCKISSMAKEGDDGTHISATCTNRKRYAWPKYF